MHRPEDVESRPALGERFRVLLEIGRTLAGTLRQDELFRVLYRETSGVLEAAGFCVTLYDAPTDQARVAFYMDKGVEQSVDLTYRGSESEVIRTGSPSLVGDRGQVGSHLVVGPDEEAVTRSAIDAPLVFKGRVLGSISVQSYRPDAYQESELELLQGIADLAAVALENARFVEQLDRRKRESDQIEEIGRTLVSTLETEDILVKVTEAARTLVPADSSSVWLIEGGSARVAASAGTDALPTGLRWTLDGGLKERLLSRQEPVRTEHLRDDPFLPERMRSHIEHGASLAVPMVVDDEVAGAVSAERASDTPFDDEDLRILRRIASQAAVALENAGLHQSVQALSLTDSLTGLPNRRHLEIHLEHEVAAARRGRDLVVILFDLDNFKQFNDSRGHLAGDEAICGFGRILQDEARAMNLVARLGGDEFVSVLSETDLIGAESYIARIRNRVQRDPLLSEGGITVSCGMAAFQPITMKTAQDVLHAADTALYAEKGTKKR